MAIWNRIHYNIHLNDTSKMWIHILSLEVGITRTYVLAVKMHIINAQNIKRLEMENIPYTVTIVQHTTIRNHIIYPSSKIKKISDCSAMCSLSK